jgi:hypothetical protein
MWNNSKNEQPSSHMFNDLSRRLDKIQTQPLNQRLVLPDDLTFEIGDALDKLQEPTDKPEKKK